MISSCTQLNKGLLVSGGITIVIGIGQEIILDKKLGHFLIIFGIFVSVIAAFREGNRKRKNLGKIHVLQSAENKIAKVLKNYNTILNTSGQLTEIIIQSESSKPSIPLPQEILEMIFKKLVLQDYLRLTLVCKEWKLIVESPSAIRGQMEKIPYPSSTDLPKNLTSLHLHYKNFLLVDAIAKDLRISLKNLTYKSLQKVFKNNIVESFATREL